MRSAEATLCIYMAGGYLPSKLHAAKVLETIVQYVSVDGNRELLSKKVILVCISYIPYVKQRREKWSPAVSSGQRAKIFIFCTISCGKPVVGNEGLSKYVRR